MGGLVEGALAVMAEQCTGRGRRGVVVAAAPIAAAIGAEALRAGGNAYDAVVAAALAETVLLPPKCGLAGDLVAIRLRAGASAPDCLLAIGGAPSGLAAAVEEHGLPDTGPLSVGVPGAPAGYALLAAEARLDNDRLAAPAVELARDGFPWAPICTALADESRELVMGHHPHGCRYFPGGQVLEPGALVTLPGLADALDEWVSRGAALLDGPVGDAVLAAVQSRGGVLERSDFAFARAEWVASVSSVTQGLRLWATPAPTHGPSLLDAMGDAHAEDRPADVWRRTQAAIARRRDTLGDPRRLSGTSMVSAADAEGNVVVVVHSNSYPRFGSGIVAEPYDLVLANRAGRGFSADPRSPNYPAPGRRPATTLHAWAAGNDGEAPTLLGATPGGANQMTFNAQLLSQFMTQRPGPGALVTAPRWEWLPDDDGVRVEAGFTEDEIAELATASSRLERVDRWGLRSAQQVVRRPVAGASIEGAVDPRTGGAALGV